MKKAAPIRATRLRTLLCAALVGSSLLATASHAQTGEAPGSDGAPVYSEIQLDQLLAPVALYPDGLLGQILMASTYPLEIVQADRWLQNPANASLRGTQLAQALQQISWDESVKSLVAFPQVLSMLDGNLDWTEQLGDAFLAQQPEVMDSVQRLRSRAQAAGTLAPSPQQTVTASDQSIEIAPADPGTVYVPVYAPEVAYGDWPDPDYPPYDFVVPGYAFGSFIGFAIVAPLWGWDQWDWRHHRLDVGPAAVNPRGGSRSIAQPMPWKHIPEHRGGVPYRDAGTRARFEGAADAHAAQGNFRGYAPAAPAAMQPGRAALPSRSAEPAPVRAPVNPPSAARRETPRAAAPMMQRPSAPALESFGHGPQVHAQEQRGASSRMSAPPRPAPSVAAPAGGRLRR